jgi:chaperonin GroEL (HSP60 family)
LIADLVKGMLGPRGLEKMFIDILGETTVTKDGATLLRKIDVEHPAAKLLIETSNTVDNSVGDGTISTVVLAGSLIEKAEQLLNMGFPPTIISAGYMEALEIALKLLKAFSVSSTTSDKIIMERLAETCLRSRSVSQLDEQKTIVRLIVDAICKVANLTNNHVDIGDIKIEEKLGRISDTVLVQGTVIDKTIDDSSMPKHVENARILILDTGIEKERTKTEAEIRIISHKYLKLFSERENHDLMENVESVINSGANVVFLRGGIDLAALGYFAKSGIVTVRRVKENDLQWLSKATGGKLVRNLHHITNDDMGIAKKVYEKFVGDDRMVFVDGCKNPKSVTLLLRATSKVILDEFHRTVLDCLFVLKNFIVSPKIVAGGGSMEAIISHLMKRRSYQYMGKEQIILKKFAEAFEEIPLTIARNAGMDTIDTLTRLRHKISSQSNLNNSESENHHKTKTQTKNNWYGINAFDRKIDNMMMLGVIEPLLVKEQIFVSAVELVSLLIRVDDVLIAKPVEDSHTHADGTTHSHREGNKAHEHFDKLGKQQRPMHHYY